MLKHLYMGHKFVSFSHLLVLIEDISILAYYLWKTEWGVAFSFHLSAWSFCLHGVSLSLTGTHRLSGWARTGVHVPSAQPRCLSDSWILQHTRVCHLPSSPSHISLFTPRVVLGKTLNTERRAGDELDHCFWISLVPGLWLSRNVRNSRGLHR